MKKLKVKTKKYGTTNIKHFFKEVLEPTLLVVNRRIVKDIAEESAREIKARIRGQLFHHEPLDPGYLNWKKSVNLDPRILIRTGIYVSNISVVEVKFPRGIGYRVGFLEGMRTPVLDSKGKTNYSKKGPLLTDLAKWLGKGTPNMKARPHFEPVYRDVVASISSIKKRMKFHIERELKKEIQKRRIK